MSKKRILVYLQNAWSKEYAGKRWPRKLWLEALHKSRSGQRLKILTGACPEFEFYFANTTLKVAPSPDICLPASISHMNDEYCRAAPHQIVVMGKQAARAVRDIYICRLLVLPHPTYRLLTNNLLLKAGELINSDNGYTGITTLTQKKGYVQIEKVNTI